MVEIIGQLLARLYQLLITYPRLVGGIALFVLFFLGAVVIWALHRHQRQPYYNMAVPNVYSDSPLLVDAGTRSVKTSTTSSTSAASHVAPVTPVLVPVTRTSSSSTNSSDLLLPLPLTTNITFDNNGVRRTSSWPPFAPIPWRSSWGFLDQQGEPLVVLDEEEKGTTTAAAEQGRVQDPGPQQHQGHGQVRQDEEVIPSSTEIEDINNNNSSSSNANYLMLPTNGARRTGSMEARKGSACTISGFSASLEDVNRTRGPEELGLDNTAAAAAAAAAASFISNRDGNTQQGRDDDGESGSGSDLIGVGGQFQLS